jgi:hypothetical protein
MQAASAPQQQLRAEGRAKRQRLAKVDDVIMSLHADGMARD